MEDVFKFRKEEGLTWLIPKVNHLMRNEMEDILREHNLSLVQWVTLSRIHRMEGCNQKQLADSSIRNGAAITRILNSLENKKLVKRKDSPNDKREFLIYLTKKGDKLYKKSEKILLDYNNDIDSIFTESELKKLNSLLNKLFSHLK